MTDRLWRVDGVNIVVSSGDLSDEEDQGSLVIVCLGSLIMAQGYLRKSPGLWVTKILPVR